VVTLSELYTNTKSLLEKANIESYVFESKCIIQHVFNINFNQLLLNGNQMVDEKLLHKISDIVKKRSSGYPLQYILGEWEFYGFKFLVGEGVLIPRQDTETLVEYIISVANSIKNPRILDLCSGSGCIAITLEKMLPNSTVCAVEFSKEALNYLTQNIKLNNSNVTVFEGDVLNKDFTNYFENFDIIVSNPPYLTKNDICNLQEEVKHEPNLALFGGDDGLQFYTSISKIWKKCLKQNGIISYEIGIGQENDVANILLNNGFTDIQTIRDLTGIIRVVSATYKPTT
jgi:release factor glutamine methyltransferase